MKKVFGSWSLNNFFVEERVRAVWFSVVLFKQFISGESLSHLADLLVPGVHALEHLAAMLFCCIHLKHHLRQHPVEFHPHPNHFFLEIAVQIVILYV